MTDRVVLALTVALLASGCAGLMVFQEGPPPGAVTASAGFPAPGTSYVMRITTEGGKTRDHTITVLPDSSYEGRAVHRVWDGDVVVVLDQATRNTVVRLRGGRQLFRFRPHEGTYAWPLWVGKKWTATYAAENEARSWDRVEEHWVVEVLEEITVPAGTYQAFRLRSTPGLRAGGRTVLWYAPAIQLAVRRISERDATHLEGPGKDTFELIEFKPAH